MYIIYVFSRCSAGPRLQVPGHHEDTVSLGCHPRLNGHRYIRSDKHIQNMLHILHSLLFVLLPLLDYKFLGIMKTQFPSLTILGLTATATSAVISDIQKILHMQHSLLFVLPPLLDYKFLGIMKTQFPSVPILGLTATATSAVISDIQKMLHIQHSLVFRASFNRNNLYYEVSVLTVFYIHCTRS